MGHYSASATTSFTSGIILFIIPSIPAFKKLPFAAIIGQVTITGVIRVEDLGMNDELINRLTMEEKAFGDYSGGRYAWILEDAVQFDKPIPARGTLSIWEYTL